jgi:hypothetical protein
LDLLVLTLLGFPPPLLFSHTGGNLSELFAELRIQREEEREEQRKRKEEHKEERKREEEERKLKERFRVHFHLWSGSETRAEYCCGRTLYQTALRVFALTLAGTEFILYVLPDSGNLASRHKLGREPPWTNCDLIKDGVEVLIYSDVTKSPSPTECPVFEEDEVLTGSSRGVQQEDFRDNLLLMAGHKDFLTGVSVQTAPGEAGESAQAGHIIPVSKHKKLLGTKIMRWDQLEKLGFPRNLYISPNGIVLLFDHHSFFDSFMLSIDVDHDHRMVVWGKDLPAAILALNGCRTAGTAGETATACTSAKLLRWHHAMCKAKHPKLAKKRKGGKQATGAVPAAAGGM